MSKQLSISAKASVLAMALFALSTQLGAWASPSPSPDASAHMETGATTSAIAPAVGRLVPALPSIR
ncbi:hypothetical protein [Aurantiacibacter suaedae]|uniref:hypothetical protein n=1 Tax=Aurantiacibacter suaedae TaxID=2545755 RepID=UPI0010F46A6D|nr:hypothetical protein [Aurantiacibacter suaedae]